MPHGKTVSALGTGANTITFTEDGNVARVIGLRVHVGAGGVRYLVAPGGATVGRAGHERRHKRQRHLHRRRRRCDHLRGEGAPRP
jgi:hypothetical protein